MKRVSFFVAANILCSSKTIIKSLEERQTKSAVKHEKSIESHQEFFASQTVFKREDFKLMLELKLRGLWHLEEFYSIISSFNRSLILSSVVNKVSTLKFVSKQKFRNFKNLKYSSQFDMHSRT